MACSWVVRVSVWVVATVCVELYYEAKDGMQNGKDDRIRLAQDYCHLRAFIDC